MIVEQTPLQGVLILTPRRFADSRGFFSESYTHAGCVKPVWTSTSCRQPFVFGSRRHDPGPAFSDPSHAQAKLVRCGRGRLWDVAVDIRKASPTYGQWFGTELSFETGRQLLIPAGFAHGFVTREPGTEILYKCTDHHAPEAEGAVRWNDPDLAINWALPAGTEPVLSTRDAKAPALADLDSPFILEDIPPGGSR